MKKRERIKNKEEFDNMIKNTNSKKNSFFIIHTNPKKEMNSRFGIAVGTKVGNAVTRNKLKRQMREIINEERILFENELDYIIIVRKSCLGLNYNQMKMNLIELIK